MAAAGAAPPESVLLTMERGGVSRESAIELPGGIEGDSSMQQEVAARKEVHPFFGPNQRVQRPSTGAFPPVSVPPTTSLIGESENELPTTHGKSGGEPVSAPKIEVRRRKGKGKVNAEVDIGFTGNLKAETLNNVEADVFRRETSDASLNALADVMGVAGIAHARRREPTQGVSIHPSASTFGGGPLESDPNKSRRKRQKTASPGVEEVPAGSQQLHPLTSDTAFGESGYFPAFGQAALIADSSGPITRSEVPQPLESPSTPPKQIIEISSDSITPDAGRAQGGSSDGILVDHRYTISLISPPPPLPLAASDDLGDRTLLSRKDSPPRKLLMLNAKGKLVSPISKRSRSRDHKKLENKKSSTSKKSKKQKMAVVKYRADSDSTTPISKKIDDILSSPPRPGSIRPLGVPEKVDKPLLPPKPTHPFFTGKLGRKLIQDTNVPTLSAVRRSSAFGTGVTTSGSDTDRGASASPRKRTEKRDVGDPDKFLGPADPRKGMASPSSVRALKVPGALEPPWPPAGMLHVRDLDELSRFEQPDLKDIPGQEPNDRRTVPRKKQKLKHTLVQVPVTEDILSCLSLRLGGPKEKAITTPELNICDLPEALRLPERILTTGHEIQRYVRREMRCFLPPTERSPRESSDTDDIYSSDDGSKKPHPALQAIYRSILTSSTPFDRAECETQSWVHKYAPKCAGQVLQPGREALILRDWLRASTVVSVDTGGVDITKTRINPGLKKQLTSGKNKAKLSKKRKKRNEDIDGFIVSSDEEMNEMDEVTDPEESGGNWPLFKRTVVRVGGPKTSGAQAGKSANAIVISGPNGCGKTAAVYAVAKELGFEVFEVNAGGRRSGKDVLEKVGEMTRNHLVHRANEEHADPPADDNTIRVADQTLRGVETRRQNRKCSLKGGVQKVSGRRPKEWNAENNPVEKQKQQSQQQKQSLILLEEVDILFDEDKQFWATVISLIAQSKRPIIMTCNDESLVPLDTLSLHAILRFVTPPEDLAIDYLLLIAANENHILRREAAGGLYSAKNRDLRASIMEVDYWCQMGIGDRKSGLEWMVQRWPPGTDVNGEGETLRVASKGSYVAGMGWLSHDACWAPDDANSDDEEEILIEAWDGWGIDVEDWHERNDIKEWAKEVSPVGKERERSHKIALNAYETFLESVSAADVYAGQGMRSGNQITHDPTQPKPPNKLSCDDVLGWHVLQSDPVICYDRLNNRMAVYAKSLAKRALRNETLDLNTDSQIESLYEQDMIESIIRLSNTSHPRSHLNLTDLLEAFALIAAPPVFITSQPTHTISSLDRTPSLIATDLAPYVRTIISNEIQREEQVLNVTGLLSQGGRNGKKARTTRASRSALAGGSRMSMRREKWFGGGVNAILVLRTGGKEWQEAAARRLVHAEDDDAADGMEPTEDTPEENSEESEM